MGVFFGAQELDAFSFPEASLPTTISASPKWALA